MSQQSTPRPRIRVAVVFGGRSSEHAVSCATAAGVMGAMDPERYEVVPIGIARDGSWVLGPTDPQVLELSAGHTPEVEPGAPGVLVPMGTDDREIIVQEEVPRSLGEVDVVFPLLHGPYGEDGTIQGLFELSDVRYVGSGVLASAVGMDKHYMKVVFAGHGLPVGPYAVVTDAQWRHQREDALARCEALGFPLFVKPARAGSSMGISKVDRPEDLVAAVEEARAHDLKVVVERGIVGRELECAVLQGRDGQPARTSAVGEIAVDPASGHAFYDFETKYLGEEGVVLSCPADVPDEVSERVRELAGQAFDVLGCEGLARVDCFWSEDGEVLVNEINTMPGFTPLSMYPRMWAASGVDYPTLVDELVHLALTRPVGLR